MLGRATEHGEIVEIQLVEIRPAQQEGARGALPDAPGARQGEEAAAHTAARKLRQVALVERAQPGVVLSHAIAVVAGERFIASFAGEYHLHVTRGELRNE